MPGLTDAHVHFFQSGGLYTRPDAIDLRKDKPYDKEIEWVHNNMEDFLRRYLQCGITSVIDVGSTYNFLQQRDSFENKNYAPSIYMTGPLLTSYEPDVFKNLKDNEPFILVKTAGRWNKRCRRPLRESATAGAPPRHWPAPFSSAHRPAAHARHAGPRSQCRPRSGRSHKSHAVAPAPHPEAYRQCSPALLPPAPKAALRPRTAARLRAARHAPGITPGTVKLGWENCGLWR